MYSPAHFSETRIDVMQALIRQHALATIVVQTPDGLVADHIPLQIEADGSGYGKLIGHVAKANPLWKIDPAQEILVIFQGPQVYISPNWYASKTTSGGKVVPTWNYAVVHVTGKLKALPASEPAALLKILTRLTQQHEAAQPHAWQVSDAPDDYIEKLCNAIVGIEIDITCMVGKWKVSQNKNATDIASLQAALTAQTDDNSTAMVALMGFMATDHKNK